MAKTATFGVMHLITAFSITYALTGSVAIAGAVTFVEPLANTVVHYFLDKYWDHARVQAWRERIATAWHGNTTGSENRRAQMQKSPKATEAVGA